ncbi:MAG: hypothetical protein B9J98_07305 [Candidatus Terraquivivens tikiterensis]|uniref:PRC-barrel domain-containing protein n=1 Tax=Candidatus Terraquivivens tikiterensis TaxID=1980982 RepID=A0A2R7Y137_9ARCH|nr:MAG: hypothetical protein B9J98_07305 [Candidatus Terraquivivens tikiterensis]
MSAVPRGKLLGMQVYNPDGTYVGTIQDIALPIGEGEIAVQVLTKWQKAEIVPWSKIGAVGDIAILKEKIEIEAPPAPEAPYPAPPASERKGVMDTITGIFKRKEMCPTCGKPLSYIEQYGRWYCYNCRKYV